MRPSTERILEQLESLAEAQRWQGTLQEQEHARRKHAE
jgi:hypothetical protein